MWAIIAMLAASALTGPADAQPASPTTTGMAPGTSAPNVQVFYVSTRGRDNWSGRLPEPNADGSDGPLASLDRARRLIRELKHSAQLAGPVSVYLRGGSYPIASPVVFTPEDSCPVTYAAFPGEQPILTGGQRAVGPWKITRVNDREVWTSTVPRVASGSFYFRSLYVDGQRRPRARWPKPGPNEAPNWLWIEDVPGATLQDDHFRGSFGFVAAPGDVRAFRNLADVEAVIMHYWIEERMPLASFDPQTRLVRSPLQSVFVLRDESGVKWARYYLDNVLEHLAEPGEWYLDRSDGTLYYIPLPGESPDNTQVVIPQLTQLIQFEGAPDEGRFVEFIRLVGITFQHTDWDRRTDAAVPGAPPEQQKPKAAAGQAAYNIPAVIQLRGARNCGIEDCTIRNIGWYGIELLEGCSANRIIGNEIADAGAGGIKLSGADADAPAHRRTFNNLITDNHIHHYGRVFHSACGILARHTFGNTLAHNHIHDGYYTGISVGWVWGFAASISRDNLIENNHIHDLGKGWLSDMGGIYTLGVQPGTRIVGNLVHDVRAYHYGGWGIYTDEGSSHIVIEDNIAHSVSHSPFHQHYGRENIVRNNIFAFGQQAVVAITRPVDRPGLTLQRNLLITRQQPIYHLGYGIDPAGGHLLADLNLCFSVGGSPLLFQLAADPQPKALELWQACGQDRHSLLGVNPRLRDAERFDFAVSDDSPAGQIGFRGIDPGQVGPRPRPGRAAPRP
ncbi:right-handed parallel beta-helix repeat-containing protein [Fontivita pretiosa]|uniref:right-handed parallel beta-helix repeat-containing protein n=1 Tax=Fontivita pretiosa TaxID=2989684 RepID=UPI003D185363